MASENFTTFTEVDPNSDITIVDSTSIVVDTMRDDVAAWVTKDYGADYFDDIVHEFEVEVTDADINGGVGVVVCPWSINNGYHTYLYRVINGDGLAIGIAYSTGTLIIGLVDFENGNFDELNISLDTRYYITVVRTGSDLSVYVYDNSLKTSLVGELNIVCNTSTYQYLDVISSGILSEPSTLSLEVYNYDIDGAFSLSSSSVSSSSVSFSSSSASSSSTSSSSTSVQPYGLRCWDSTGNITLDVTDRITRVLFKKEVASGSNGNQDFPMPPGGANRTFGFAYALESDRGQVPHDVSVVVASSTKLNISWTAVEDTFSAGGDSYPVLESANSLIIVMGW